VTHGSATGLLGHGVGTRADLPLPVSYVVVGGGLAVVVSFVALGALWRTPRLRGDLAGRPVPAVVAALLDGRRPRGVLRGVVLALTVLVVVVAFGGSPEVAGNTAPWAFFVTFWVGLVPAAAALVGDRWFARCEGFEVYSRLLGRLAPLGRRRDGRLVLHTPLDGAASQPRRRGLAAVVVVLVGSTAFDGVGRTLWWQSGFGIDGDAAVGPATLGLAAAIAVVGAGYASAAALSGRLGSAQRAVRRYAHTLIPIAAGYAVAHYCSLLVFDGQATWILLSDPFATGADLLGLTGRGVDYGLVSARTIALVQVAAVVGGHVFGVVLAHDTALVPAADRSGRGHPVRAQVPLLVLMVGLTTAGLGLLLGA
jgi:hypothetical protein